VHEGEESGRLRAHQRGRQPPRACQATQSGRDLLELPVTLACKRERKDSGPMKEWCTKYERKEGEHGHEVGARRTDVSIPRVRWDMGMEKQRAPPSKKKESD